MTHKPLDFNQVEALRKRMLLTVANMADLLGVSRQGYYGWKRGGAVHKDRDAEVRGRIKSLLSALLDYGWPTPEAMGMENAERFKALKTLLEEIE